MTSGDRGTWRRWLAVAALVAVAGIFSFLNSGELATVNIGVTTLYRISLVGLVFGAFLLGMVAMFLFGLRYDRRVREVLRQQSLRQVPPLDQPGVPAVRASAPSVMSGPPQPAPPATPDEDSTQLLPPDFIPRPTRLADRDHEEQITRSIPSSPDDYTQPLPTTVQERPASDRIIADFADQPPLQNDGQQLTELRSSQPEESPTRTPSDAPL